MSNQLAKSSKDFFAMPNVKAKLTELLGFNDSPEFHIELVEKIPLKKRIKTVTIKRDESLYQKIIEKVTLAREYYNRLLEEIK